MHRQILLVYDTVYIHGGYSTTNSITWQDKYTAEGLMQYFSKNTGED